MEKQLVRNQSYVLNAKNVGLHNHWFNVEELDEFYESDPSSSVSEEEGTSHHSWETRTQLLNRCFSPYFAG